MVIDALATQEVREKVFAFHDEIIKLPVPSQSREIGATWDVATCIIHVKWSVLMIADTALRSMSRRICTRATAASHERHAISNHQQLCCFSTICSGRTSNETPKPRVIVRESTGDQWKPLANGVSNPVSIPALLGLNRVR